jgi:CHAT domain-containing protein
VAIALLTCHVHVLFAYTARSPAGVRQLTPGVRIERALSNAHVHAYELRMERGDYVHLTVDQQGVDVVVRVFGPDGHLIATIDAVDDAFEPEAVNAIAEDAGTYRIEISRSASAPPRGRYAIRVDDLRPAEPLDTVRVDAARAFEHGHELRAAGRPDAWSDALAAFDTARSSYAAAGDARGTMNVLLAIGDLQWRLARPGAEATARQAEGIARDLGDRAATSIALRVIGSACGRTSDYACALRALDEATAIDTAEGHRAAQADDLNRSGVIYGRTDSAEEAIARFARALPLARAARSSTIEANLLNNMGIAYRDLGKYDASLRWYAQALASRRAAGDLEFQATALNNMGNLQRLLGRNEQALALHTRALALARQSGGAENEARSLNTIGLTYYALGQYAKALDYHRQSLAMRETMGDWPGQAASLEGAGRAWHRLGDDHAALDVLTNALTIRRRIREQYGEPDTLRDLAAAERGLGHLDAAVADARAAVDLDEALRARITSPDLRATFVAAAHDKYEVLIDLLQRQHAAAPPDAADAGERAALDVSERARARVLLESLLDARVDLREGIEPGLLERERTLQRQLNDASARLSRVLGAARQSGADAAAQAVEQLSEEYRRLQAHIRQQSPRYAAITQPQPLTTADIQQSVLDSDTVLLEFSLGAERSWLWAVTRTTLTSVELPPRREVETAVRSLDARFTARQRRPGESRADAAARVAMADARRPAEARAMSRMLFGGIARQLRDEWRGKRLAIVADEALAYLPFAALPDPAALPLRVAGDANRVPILADGHEIVTIPSASVLAVLRRETRDRPPAAAALAILADPVFDANDPRVHAAPAVARAAERDNRPAAARRRTTFARLPFSREEASAIAEVTGPLGVFEATDFRASRATVLDGALRGHRIVHLATHGVIDSERPALTGLVLSLVNEHGAGQNGYVRLADIYNMRLDADLVVLSACQTALGKEIKGEGLVGLARAFMYAGAPRVVATLWEVNDAATAALMTRFYRGVLQEKRSPAAALRQAQLEMSRDPRWSAPYYWAGFVMQGDWRERSLSARGPAGNSDRLRVPPRSVSP